MHGAVTMVTSPFPRAPEPKKEGPSVDFWDSSTTRGVSMVQLKMGSATMFIQPCMGIIY